MISGWEARLIVKEAHGTVSKKTMHERYKPTRMTKKQLDENLERHLHPNLFSNSRVSIQKFEANKFKRGLSEDEKPFPVIAKLGPYIVSLLK